LEERKKMGVVKKGREKEAIIKEASGDDKAL